MNTKQEHIYYWCRGSKENPDGVIKALTEKGAIGCSGAISSSDNIKGEEEGSIYYYSMIE